MTIWRINLKTAANEGISPFTFCKDRNIVGLGWPIDTKPIDSEDLKKQVKLKYNSSRGSTTAMNAITSVKKEDLIWVRDGGSYYIAKVIDTWEYKDSQEYIDADVVNIIKVDNFNEVGTVEKIPGKIVNSFRARSTLQRIDSDTIDLYSKIIYQEKTQSNLFSKEISEFHQKQKEIFDFLQPEDVEEIILLYLQINEGYYVYTSSNKIDTQKYEAVLIKNDASHFCYPQVKTGNKKLNGNDFEELTKDKNKVYLFATSENYEKSNNENIIYLEKQEILNFMNSKIKFLPDRIKHWIAFYNSYQSI